MYKLALILLTDQLKVNKWQQGEKKDVCSFNFC